MTEPTSGELRRGSPTPLYVQLDELLRNRIASGYWKPGQRIPSENELNRIYGLSRMTVRGVLNTLVGDGLLFRVPGKGTFVLEPKIETVSPAYRGVREQLEAQGISTTTRLISTQTLVAPVKVAQRLGLERGAKVHAIKRVRSARGAPVSVHHSWVPLDLAPSLDEYDPVQEQLCVILSEHFGLSMGQVDEVLESTVLSATEASVLESEEGSPALVLEDTISTSAGLAFEYSKIIFRGDKIRLHFSMRV